MLKPIPLIILAFFLIGIFPVNSHMPEQPLINQRKNSVQYAKKKYSRSKKPNILEMVRTTAANWRISTLFFETLIRQESQLSPYALHLSTPRQKPIGWKLRSLGVNYRWYQTKSRHHYVIINLDRDTATRILRWAMRFPWIDFDVGLGQINRRKLKDLKVSPITALDPQINLTLAAQIFKQCLDQTQGHYFAAAECYHRGRFNGVFSRYSLKLARALSKKLRSKDIYPR